MHIGRLLDEIMARNHRIRQSLQRVAAGVREYDVLQGNLMKSFQVPYRALPADLLDAFCHDPSAVTGVTRSYKGWRAVEDIHNRVIRQRETFRAFLNSSPKPPIASKSVFDEPISALHDLFGKLEARQAAIAAKAREITGILTRVKGIHASVKTEYNETVSHTSVAYPEVRSGIIALFLPTDKSWHFLRTAISNHCPGRELQGSISATLGVWSGHANHHP